MEIAELVLEYLKVILGAPVLALAGVMIVIRLFRDELKKLIDRIATIRLPGGAEVTTTQTEQIEQLSKDSSEPNTLPAQIVDNLPQDLPDDQKEEIQKKLGVAQATARLWEYRYLNLFLVYNTQRVLNWFDDLAEPVDYLFFDAEWRSIIIDPKERNAIFDALKSHYLIVEKYNGLFCISEKGKEYIAWRGPIPRPIQRGAIPTP